MRCPHGSALGPPLATTTGNMPAIGGESTGEEQRDATHRECPGIRQPVTVPRSVAHHDGNDAGGADAGDQAFQKDQCEQSVVAVLVSHPCSCLYTVHETPVASPPSMSLAACGVSSSGHSVCLALSGPESPGR